MTSGARQSEEHEPNPAHVPLRDFVEQRFDAMDRALMLALENMNKRLDGMNEFREALRDQAQRARTRDECDVIRSKIEEDVRSLRESRAELAGKASQLSMNITLAIAILGLATSMVGIFVK